MHISTLQVHVSHILYPLQRTEGQMMTIHISSWDQRLVQWKMKCILANVAWISDICFQKKKLKKIIVSALTEVTYLVGTLNMTHLFQSLWSHCQRRLTFWAAAGEEVVLLFLTAFDSQRLHASQVLVWSQQSQFRSSFPWNHSWISLWAPSSESLAWTTFLLTWMLKSPLTVPAWASAGLVCPTITRDVWTTFCPSHTMTTTGPEVM